MSKLEKGEIEEKVGLTQYLSNISYEVIDEVEVQTPNGPEKLTLTSHTTGEWSWLFNIIKEYEARFEKLTKEIEQLKSSCK